ncbi:hypothetical protein PS687_02584 [Pseudomonas fluorescens]|nr:hypothetical protein PS687_02584 [Pseudomonas fluorescens]
MIVLMIMFVTRLARLLLELLPSQHPTKFHIKISRCF